LITVEEIETRLLNLERVAELQIKLDRNHNDLIKDLISLVKILTEGKYGPMGRRGPVKKG